VSSHVIAVQTVLFFCSWRRLTANQAGSLLMHYRTLTTYVFPTPTTQSHCSKFIFFTLDTERVNWQKAYTVYYIYSTAPEPLQGPQMYCAQRTDDVPLQQQLLPAAITRMKLLFWCRNWQNYIILASVVLSIGVLNRPTTANPASVNMSIIIHRSPQHYDHFPNRGKKRSHLNR